MSRDDEFWGVEFDEEKGSFFTGLPYSGTQCTGFACRIRQKLGSDRVKIFGFPEKENPDSIIAQMSGGHDFALVDDRYIVDPWIMEVESGNITTPSGQKAFAEKGVFDLQDPLDRERVEKLYGSPKNWRRMTEVEAEAD